MRLCSRLADSGKELSLDIVAQETMLTLNVTGNSSLYLNLLRTPVLKAIFGWKRCALYLRKYGSSVLLSPSNYCWYLSLLLILSSGFYTRSFNGWQLDVK